MGVIQDGAVIRLEEACHVEEAEMLTSLLQRMPGSTVDLSRCRSLHAAVVQALLAFGPPVSGWPEDAFLRDLLVPALAGERQPLLPPV